MKVNDSILIIGHPKSGKTTFLAQFYNRVRKRKSSIKLLKTHGNIKAIIDASKRLSEGEEPQPTPANENVELVLHVEVGKKQIDIICPDYGGEQVKEITELMEIDETWLKLINESNRWLLFIRPGEITPEYDLSINSYEKIEIEKSKEFKSPGLSSQSKFIELLQALLFAKDTGVKNSITKPKLFLILTCWDELKTKDNPIQVLKKKSPMLLHFIETLWDKDAFEILGLSSQEFPLTTQKAKDKYLDELPENFGYYISQEGIRDNDITKLVKMGLE